MHKSASRNEIQMRRIHTSIFPASPSSSHPAFPFHFGDQYRGRGRTHVRYDEVCGSPKQTSYSLINVRRNAFPLLSLTFALQSDFLQQSRFHELSAFIYIIVYATRWTGILIFSHFVSK
jgi:hypothetical protein